jgi:Asp-tRNA(Asn)/Glu-tRNA(Gln) amidotransferase A subunit family amidase
VSTIRELAAAVRERRVGARELVGESLRRIAERDGPINAVVALRAEEALAEAAALDERIIRGEEAGALAGVPTLIKDMFDVTGMRTTFGSRAFEAAAATTTDARGVARLRAAAAIVVGKTNMPEFAMEGYTSNALFGTTGNPWNLERSTGGSSGGSAAAIAAGLAPIATATDGGGSIRIPAAYCGLVGLKPSSGVIGRDPIPDWIDYSTEGPFASCVEDLRVLLDVQRGPVDGDPSAVPAWVGAAPPMGPGRVFSIERFSEGGPLPVEVAGSFERAIAGFGTVFGRDVERIDARSLFGEGSVDEDWFVVAPVEHAHRFGRAWIEEHRDLLMPATREFFAWGLSVTIEDYLAARRRRFDYVRALDALLGDDGLLLSPVMAVDAGPADGGGVASGADWYCTAAQNVTGHPALSLPAGSHPSGVPFGLQVTGPRFREELLLDVATRWEEAEPWPRTAPGFDVFG